VADALVARGEHVTLLDNLSTGSRDNVEHLAEHPRVSFHEGTILDADLVEGLVDAADVVVHLAASVGVELIIRRPLESLINNIRGTEIVLEACADLGRKVLVASTSEIYGKNVNGPLREESDRILGSPFKARWSYSTSKAVDEILAYTYWRERGTPSIVVRLFNTVGPRQTGAYGMVVPRFVQQALRGETLTVHADGKQSRCFCHVEDSVRGLIALLDHPGSVGQVFNVGSQEEVTINELAARVMDRTSSTSRVEHMPYDVAYEDGFEDMLRRVPDISRIGELAGWEPTKSLNDIIDDVVEFEKAKLAAASR
jgi:UDP-glucose 4-epimerase